jgi:hypothetical protein
MNRRSFLHLLGLSAAGLAVGELELDLDRLLWVPGQKTIFLPPVPVGNQLLTADWIDWITQETLRILEHDLKFSQHINRQYDERFVDRTKVVTTIAVRRPPRFA